ncbi:MAG: hypothetical protein V4482_02240 [Pseudomonadota bacterium]
MFKMRIIILFTIELITPLYASTPETYALYTEEKIGITTNVSRAHDAARLYTYYQGKLLSDLIAQAASSQADAPLWSLLQKGLNPEKAEQSTLEWHAEILKKRNWGDSNDYQWIHATSQSDMILGFLTSAYTSVCLSGTSVASNIDSVLAEIQKQTVFFLQSNTSIQSDQILQTDMHPLSLLIKASTQVGRNVYYRNLYRNNLALTEANSMLSTSGAHDETGVVATEGTAGATEVTQIITATTEIPQMLDVMQADRSITASEAALSDEMVAPPAINHTPHSIHELLKRTPHVTESITTLRKIFLNATYPAASQIDIPLSEDTQRNLYMFALASMAVLDADYQQFDWVTALKKHLDTDLITLDILSNPRAPGIDSIFLAAKKAVTEYRYNTPSYFSYGYKALPDPLNPIMETINGQLLFGEIPLPPLTGRVIPVDLGFMYAKLKETGDYGLQYIKPMHGNIVSRMVEHIQHDIGITTTLFSTINYTITQQIQEGLTLTTNHTATNALYSELNPMRETTAPHPIAFSLTPEYCQWKDIVHFLNEILRVISSPDLIHQRANFGHSFDLTNKDFNLVNDAFRRQSEAQITQEEADAIMRGTWYKEVLNFVAAYHYAHAHNMFLNFYENALPSAKAENPCLPGKIRQATTWHEIQSTKQRDQLSSAIRMLFPASNTYEGIQFNAFLDLITPVLSRDFITQKIEHYAMENSIFAGGDIFDLDAFQKGEEGAYSLKKTHYQTVLERPDFEVDIAPIAFESFARELLFNKLTDYIFELNAVSSNGIYAHPAAHQLFSEGSGIQAFHSGDVVLSEYMLPELPSIILDGAIRVNGALCAYGLLGTYIYNLQDIIDAIKQNPYR